jgi:hypothetical protein
MSMAFGKKAVSAPALASTAGGCIDSVAHVTDSLRVGPVYDSTFTDGSQDRYVTYEELKEDFKKVR